MEVIRRRKLQGQIEEKWDLSELEEGVGGEEDEEEEREEEDVVEKETWGSLKQ